MESYDSLVFESRLQKLHNLYPSHSIWQWERINQKYERYIAYTVKLVGRRVTRNSYTILVGKLHKKSPLGSSGWRPDDIVVTTLTETVVQMWTRLNWLTTESNGGLLLWGSWTFGFSHKRKLDSLHNYRSREEAGPRSEWVNQLISLTTDERSCTGRISVVSNAGAGSQEPITKESDNCS